MKRKLLASTLLLSLAVCATVRADVDPVTKAYVESLDERLSIEESKSGYSITMDITDSENDIQNDVQDFYWYVVQLLNETSSANDLIEKKQFTCFMKKGRELHGFYVSDYKNHWEFTTGETMPTSTAVCTPFAGVFEHTYRSVFGGHDQSNLASAEIYEYLLGQKVDAGLPSSYQNGCYLLYSYLRKGSSVTLYSTSLIATMTTENTYDAGAEENGRIQKILQDFLPLSMFYEFSMPYEKLTLNYYDQSGNVLAKVTVDFNTSAVTVDEGSNSFVDGLCLNEEG